jgi:4-hydroxyphenylpyruvate dioxygenase-like putative hemolysin
LNLKMATPQEYDQLQARNQYLGWTLIHGEAINHVALVTPNIENFYSQLQLDPQVNIATGLQVSQDRKLKQFSLQADQILHTFPNGEIRSVPAYFVEFIERINGREGFEVGNARQIFKSTA